MSQLVATATQTLKEAICAALNTAMEQGSLPRAELPPLSLIHIWVIFATFFLLGSPEADSIPQAFLMRTAAGGVFVMNVKERSA